MANVLGELFQNIANAIRSKTGTTGTMKPADFPAQIENISAESNLTILEDIPIELDMSQGNQTISAGEGYAVKSAILQKPDTLVPENILKDVEIAGVTGTCEAEQHTILEDVELELDFTSGNQEITVPEGYAVKSGIIQKPDTLVAGNIREGVDIAGVIGTMAATSGGKMGVRVTSGSYTGVTDGPAVINHGMGATPDFVFVYAYYIPLEETAGLISTYGFSDAILKDFQYSEGEGEHPEFYRRLLFYKTTANAGNEIGGFVDDEKGIENTSVLGMINSANSTTFTVGTKTVKHYDRTYYWFAVCFDK